MKDFTKNFATSNRKSFDEGLRKYFQRIYMYMASALLITGASALAVFAFSPLTMLIYNVAPTGQLLGLTGFGTLLAFAPLALGLYFFWGLGSMTVQKAQTLFWVYSVLMGFSLSSLAFMYTGASIARTFFITASVFGGMSIYGYTTNKDLTSIGSFMIMGIWGLIIASIVNIFFSSPGLDFAISLLGVIIFTGMIAWDTQKLKSLYYQSGGVAMGDKIAILGAFQLYLDFVNLFLYLIRFLGVRRN